MIAIFFGIQIFSLNQILINYTKKSLPGTKLKIELLILIKSPVCHLADISASWQTLPQTAVFIYKLLGKISRIHTNLSQPSIKTEKFKYRNIKYKNK